MARNCVKTVGIIYIYMQTAKSSRMSVVTSEFIMTGCKMDYLEGDLVCRRSQYDAAFLIQ